MKYFLLFLKTVRLSYFIFRITSNRKEYSKCKPFLYNIIYALHCASILPFQNNKGLMNKQEYFSYFQERQQTQINPTTQSKQGKVQRPKTSHYSIPKSKKLLPHIVQEYQYRITNQLLQEKINHPKRDKLIAESFSTQNYKLKKDGNPSSKFRRGKEKKQKENQSQKQQTKKQSQGVSRLAGGPRSKTCKIQRVYKTFDDLSSSCFNYKNDYLISLQNNRMGKRLINTRSMVQDLLTKTYYTYQLYNGKILNKDKFLSINRNSIKFRSCNKNFGKINNGIKCFFQNVITDDSEKFNELDSDGDIYIGKNQIFRDNLLIKEIDSYRQLNACQRGYQTNNPNLLQAYGKGELAFVIKRFIIYSNPPIKPDAILTIQLIEKDQKLSQILNSFYSQNHSFANKTNQEVTLSQLADNKDCHTTAPFPYEYMSSNVIPNFGLKFYMRPHNYIYLRILRSQGISERDLGVVRVNLQSFRTKKQGQFPFELIQQNRQIKGDEKRRQIFSSEFKGNLYKFKKGEVSSSIHIEYQLYNRNFQQNRKKIKQFDSTMDKSSFI